MSIEPEYSLFPLLLAMTEALNVSLRGAKLSGITVCLLEVGKYLRATVPFLPHFLHSRLCKSMSMPINWNVSHPQLLCFSPPIIIFE